MTRAVTVETRHLGDMLFDLGPSAIFWLVTFHV
jgi:hypothetical protein